MEWAVVCKPHDAAGTNMREQLLCCKLVVFKVSQSHGIRTTVLNLNPACCFSGWLSTLPVVSFKTCFMIVRYTFHCLKIVRVLELVWHCV